MIFQPIFSPIIYLGIFKTVFEDRVDRNTKRLGVKLGCQ